MADIKKCPFCGHTATLTQIGNDRTKKRSAEIKCDSCGVKMVVGAIRWPLEKVNEICVMKWNLRSSI